MTFPPRIHPKICRDFSCFFPVISFLRKKIQKFFEYLVLVRKKIHHLMDTLLALRGEYLKHLESSIQVKVYKTHSIGSPTPQWNFICTPLTCSPSWSSLFSSTSFSSNKMESLKWNWNYREIVQHHKLYKFSF